MCHVRLVKNAIFTQLHNIIPGDYINSLLFIALLFIGFNSFSCGCFSNSMKVTHYKWMRQIRQIKI